ncbi:MAG: hypothetical protein NVS4B3_27030 [Gemmatimonadaceae bacterium]
MNMTRPTLLVIAVALLNGCGAILHGTLQTIDVQSTPSGAKVDASPVAGVYTTPMTLNLERKHNYLLTFSSPGYSPATVNINSSFGLGTVVADVLLTGLVGVVVDAATGGWYGLSPENVSASLTRTTGTRPETIRIHVGQTNGGRTVGISADRPDVRVEVLRK